MEVKKVLVRRDGVKMVFIPKKSDIDEGDYVKIVKINEQEVKDGREKR